MTANVETMAYAGEKPWHGIGTQVSEELMPMEMLKSAKLDWKVLKKNVYFENDGRYIQADTRNHVLVRSDNRR